MPSQPLAVCSLSNLTIEPEGVAEWWMTIHFQSRGGAVIFQADGPERLPAARALAADLGNTFGPSKLGGGSCAVIGFFDDDDDDDDDFGVADCGLWHPVSAASTKIEIPTARSAQRSVFKVVAIPGPRAIAYKAIPLDTQSPAAVSARDNGTVPSAHGFAKKLPVRGFYRTFDCLSSNLKQKSAVICMNCPFVPRAVE